MINNDSCVGGTSIVHAGDVFINTNKFGAAGQGRGWDRCACELHCCAPKHIQRTRPKVHSGGGGRRINRLRVLQNKVSAGELMARENCINFNSTATCLNSKWAHFLRWKEQKRHKSTSASWWKMKSTPFWLSSQTHSPLYYLRGPLRIYLGTRTSRCSRWNLCDKLEMQVWRRENCFAGFTAD